MIKFKNITFVHSEDGDWTGIYIDGKLVQEKHSFDADDMCDILGIEYKSHWVDMEDGARLPQKLSDVKLPKEKDNG